MFAGHGFLPLVVRLFRHGVRVRPDGEASDTAGATFPCHGRESRRTS